MSELPRLFQHTYSLYQKMLEESTVDDAGNRIYVGSLVAAFRALEISQSYYSPLYGALKEMGSIEVLHSGRGGGEKSRVLLLKPPELEAFQEIYTTRLTNPTSAVKLLEQRVENIEGRLPSIDLANYIIETEQRLKVLEEREG